MVKLAILMSFGFVVGCVLRYLVTIYAFKYFKPNIGIVLLSTLGCYLAGLVIGLVDRYFTVNEILRLLFPLGFSMGFLLFSVLSTETLEDIRSGKKTKAFCQTSAVVTLSYLAVWAGLETVL